MPRGDRTGPMGAGPMTGRAAGYCAGYSAPGFMSPGAGQGWGRGRGRGFGMGMGWGRGSGYPFAAYSFPAPYGAPAAPQNEVDLLKSQAKYLQESLESINERIAGLEAEKK